MGANNTYFFLIEKSSSFSPQMIIGITSIIIAICAFWIAYNNYIRSNYHVIKILYLTTSMRANVTGKYISFEIIMMNLGLPIRDISVHLVSGDTSYELRSYIEETGECPTGYPIDIEKGRLYSCELRCYKEKNFATVSYGIISPNEKLNIDGRAKITVCSNELPIFVYEDNFLSKLNNYLLIKSNFFRELRETGKENSMEKYLQLPYILKFLHVPNSLKYCIRSFNRFLDL